MIFPEIFDGHAMGFFTDKELGVNIKALTDREIYFPKQEHTDIVIELDPDLTPKVADAVITDRFDVILGIKVADCVPMLLFDTQNLVIGVVHAGWRGTSKGVLKKTINAMSERYKTHPSNVLLAIGPSIRWCCYEVGQEVLDAVVTETGEGFYYKNSENKRCLDLQSANLVQATSVGILEQNISITDDCTLCETDKYNSYRRDKTTVRQGGFIGLP